MIDFSEDITLAFDLVVSSFLWGKTRKSADALLFCCMTGGSELDVTFEGNFYTKHEGLVRFRNSEAERHRRHVFRAQLLFVATEWNNCPVIIKFFLYNGFTLVFPPKRAKSKR